MTREDIIRMAREVKGAARQSATDGSLWLLSESHLETFAALVAAAEREACAVIAEIPISGEQDDITMQAKDRVAAAIRARGQA
jgi:hypothetical protein